jgi:hypothetical protein
MKQVLLLFLPELGWVGAIISPQFRRPCGVAFPNTMHKKTAAINFEYAN